MKITTKKQQKERRRCRVRSRVSGTAQRPRLTVFRSLTGMYIQIIDDERGVTLASVNSKKHAVTEKGKVKVAFTLGKILAEQAKQKSITKVVFDRAGYKYCGRVKALAEGAREGGLEF